MKYLSAIDEKASGFLEKSLRSTCASLCFLILMIATILLSACSEESSQANASTWTLHSGVEVLYDSGCQKTTGNLTAVDVHKEEKRYVVAINGYQSCQYRLKAPWLTQTRGNKATLVINETTATNTSNCECSRSVKIAITDRLEKGDILFVVAESEVLGHVEIK